MGHVDTGKTKLLDKIRKTNVQEGEAGGITQQIGATYFEKKTLETQTAKLNETEKVELTVPGMLVIDTPGHESFTNLRSRGSSLCDVAILVVDLMHGLEQQTIESLTMLRNRGVPFVVALNKVDRCYAWKTCKDAPIRDALKEQEEGTISEFRSRASDAKLQLQEQGVNTNLYWEMGDEDWTNSDFIPLVPTSAVTGEGVQDLLLLLCQISQRKLWEKLMWCANLQCTVLEVKAIDGLGMTVDVLVVNGHLREGDKAVFCTLDGPIVTEIRGLLTPPPSREMRIKSEYIHHKQVKGALGVKVIGNNLDKVMAGTPVLVVGPGDEEEDIKAEVMSDLTKLEDKLSTDKQGVLVQASTLGALEALLQFLREDTKPPIPVSAIGIGTIHKRDVTKISIMNEKGHPEYATILAFDVDIEKEAREHAQVSRILTSSAVLICAYCWNSLHLTTSNCYKLSGDECAHYDGGHYLPSLRSIHTFHGRVDDTTTRGGSRVSAALCAFGFEYGASLHNLSLHNFMNSHASLFNSAGWLCSRAYARFYLSTFIIKRTPSFWESKLWRAFSR